MISKKKNPKFTGKPQLACLVCSFMCVTSITPRNNLTIQNFATSKAHEKWSRPHRTLFFFSINLTKNAKKTRGKMFCTVASMTSLTLNSNLYNFSTS